MGYTDEQIEVLEVINWTCASLSVAGSLFIMISYLIFSKLRERFSYSLVFYLATSDMIRSIGKIWGSFLSSDAAHDDTCSIAGLVTNFGGLSSFIFVAVIAIVMYTAVNIRYAKYWDVKNDVLQRRRYYVAISVWLITLILSLLPFSQSSYGYVGAWCWINNDYHHWRWICFYGPLIFIFFFCIVMYSVIINHLRKIEEMIPERNRGNYKMFMNLRYYPLVLVVAFLFPTIRRMYQMFHDEAPFWLGVCHTLGAGLYGGLNAFVYGVNRSLKREYKSTLDGTIRSHNMKVVQTIEIENQSPTYSCNSPETKSFKSDEEEQYVD